MKRSGTYRLLLLLLLCCVSIASISQTLKAEIDRDNIVIGEQIHLTIKAEGIKAAENYVRKWIDLPDTINHIEVVERSKVDTIYIGREIIYQQAITITSFDSGQWQIPALRLGLENKSIAVTTISSQPLTINVSPVDVSQLKDYHDIKDILQVENKDSKWILISIIALTLISLAAIFIYSRRKRTLAFATPTIAGDRTPLDWALMALDDLKKHDLSSKEQIKQYYLKLSHICRQYFDLQLQQKTLHQTSDEWMVSLQSLPLESATRTSFIQFIRLADTVKFAKYTPPAYEQEQSLAIARKMVMDVAQLKYSIPVTAKKLQ